MDNELMGPQLDEVHFVQCGDDGIEMLAEQREEVIVADVAGCDDQQAAWVGPEKMASPKSPTSWPATDSRWASRKGSWASNRNLTQRRGAPPAASPR